MRHRNVAALAVLLLAACAPVSDDTGMPATFSGDGAALIRNWAEGGYAFGVFVPSAQPMVDGTGNRRPGVYTVEAAAELGRNELLDFLFLRLDGAYDVVAVDTIVEGLSTIDRANRPVLLVGIDRESEALTRQRVEEVLVHGADGVIVPHIRSPEDAALAVSFFADIGADVWSPDNPDGKIIAMLMIEDGDALAAAENIAATDGYSVLACGVGSLAGDLGDSEAAEVACTAVKGHADRLGLPSMMTAFDREMLMQRIDQGYRWILMLMNDETSDLVRTGRSAAERQTD